MAKAPPDNLGSRQRALNARVNEAAETKVNFAKVIAEAELTELDRLYTIDVAAKYRNVDYILEVLKSGDSLYTARALKKCQWIYSDEYSHIMNPDFLQNNIFPFTSLKMKRKIVKAVAAHATNPKRAEEFYHYCMKEKMSSTAFTSFLYTTEHFKLDQLRNNKDPAFKALENKDILYFRFLVGKSFDLLDALLGFISVNWKISKTARQFKNFFYDSEEKYLDIAEKYVSTYFRFQTDKFDPKLSDSIMKRHKHRVLTSPQFYVNTVNTDVLVRNSTIDDAKIYTKTLLPDTAYEFWALHHYTIFRSVFEIIPHDQTYAFFKDFFAERYPGKEFEMHPGFYEQKYYKFMTYEQREEWGLCQLKNEKQILGIGRDYLWYRFINFNTAFEQIKRLVSITKEADKRNDMVEVLVESARNDRELETLFVYYHKRHMSELRRHRESFLKKVLSHHNVFEINEACWSGLYTLLLAMDVVNTDEKETEENRRNKQNYKTVALLYHIIHKKEMPDRLTTYLLDEFRIHCVRDHLKNVTNEKQQMLHEYFFTFYMNIITESKDKTFGHTHFQCVVEAKWKRYLDNMDKSMEMFNEDGEEYTKPSGNQSRKRRRRECCGHHITGRSLIRDLKKDKAEAIDNLPRAQREFEAFPIKINVFLKKIKIYFPDDVTKSYLDMFQKIILNDKLVNENCHRSIGHVGKAVQNGVNAIFQLADVEEKVDFMRKYCPVATISKTERKKLGLQHQRIQRAICRYARLSRPPVPHSCIVAYMKGDMAKSCLHTFDTYLALLPIPMCQQFVNSVIDTPVSIQKHAIRLAFQCFQFESLKEIILNIWTNTKNVTLRRVIYKAFYNKVVDTKEERYYDVLKLLTVDLDQDDESEVWNMTVSKKNKLPDDFLGDFISAVWEAADKLKDVEPNVTLKKNVIMYMREHIRIIEEQLAAITIQSHMDTMFLDDKLRAVYSKENIAPLYIEKWQLTAHYIVYSLFHDPLEKKGIQLVQFIFRKNIQSWGKMAYGIHVHQKSCWDVLGNLKNICLQETYGRFENTVPIFVAILQTIDTDLQYYDNYLLTWELQMILLSANMIRKNRGKCNGDKFQVVSKLMVDFGNDVVEVLIQFIANDIYYKSFSPTIKDMISNYVEEFLKLVYKEMNDSAWKEFLNDSLVSLAEVLAKMNYVETILLAIQILSENCDDCYGDEYFMNKSSKDKFTGLIKKLQEFPNEEVQLHLYHKLQKYCERKPQ